MKAIILVLLASLALETSLSAEGPAQARPGETAKKRSKSIEFEDNVVEGMNKNPLDALQQVGREDSKMHGRLYKKRTEFQSEIRHSVQEAGYSP